MSRLPNGECSYKAAATALAWNGTKRFLCCGFEDGALFLWSLQEPQWSEMPFRHSGRVTVVAWSPEGRRVIAGDESGTVSLWRIDSAGSFTFLVKYTKKGQISQCVFKVPPGTDTSNSIECPPFLIAGDAGVVHLADDAGHCVDFFAVHRPIAAVVFMEGTQSVLTVTTDAIVSVHRQDGTGKMTQIMKVKVAAASGESAIRAARLVGPSLLAYLSAEDVIRFWDLRHDNNYVLRLTDVASAVPSAAAAMASSSGGDAGAKKRGMYASWDTSAPPQLQQRKRDCHVR